VLFHARHHSIAAAGAEAPREEAACARGIAPLPDVAPRRRLELEAEPRGHGRQRAITAIVVDPSQPNVVCAGSSRSGLFVSSDAGKTRRVHDEGPRTRSILALAISAEGRTLYAGTHGEGVFRLSTLSQAEFDRLGAPFSR
jgi:hypothetical protein